MEPMTGRGVARLTVASLMVALPLVGLPPAASADLIVTTDHRNVLAFTQVQGDSDACESPAIETPVTAAYAESCFSALTGADSRGGSSASQTSVLGALEFSGNGTASSELSHGAQAALVRAFANSVMFVLFEIDGRYLTTFSASVSGTPPGSEFAGGSWSAFLFDYGDNAFVWSYIATTSPAVLHNTAVLTAGLYGLNVTVAADVAASDPVTASHEAHAAFDFHFQFVPAAVPEPAPLSLIAVALVALLRLGFAGMRRRNQ